jgi:hypothetical protein
MRPACKLILAHAPVEAITRQLSVALFMVAALDLRCTKRARAKATVVDDPGHWVASRKDDWL